MIAGIEARYGWETFKKMKQKEVVGQFWDAWKRMMRRWDLKEPTTTAEFILNSLSSHPVDIPPFVRSFVKPLS